MLCVLVHAIYWVLQFPDQRAQSLTTETALIPRQGSNAHQANMTYFYGKMHWLRVFTYKMIPLNIKLQQPSMLSPFTGVPPPFGWWLLINLSSLVLVFTFSVASCFPQSATLWGVSFRPLPLEVIWFSAFHAFIHSLYHDDFLMAILSAEK